MAAGDSTGCSGQNSRPSCALGSVEINRTKSPRFLRMEAMSDLLGTRELGDGVMKESSEAGIS